MTNIKNSTFTVLGAGRSGIAAAKLLKRNGASVFLSDESNGKRLKYFDENIFKETGIEFELGRHSERVFESDVIIKSPGIPAANEIIIKAAKLGKKIYSEIEAAFWFCKAPVIAITGTNGKTTTTILTGEIFRNAGIDTKVCGNVGLAFSEIVEEAEEDSVVVLEVSSFQLNDIEKFKPKVSVIMNITPDHLEWHKSFKNYLTAKLNIMKNQTKSDYAVINYDDNILKQAVNKYLPEKSFFSIKENLKNKDIQSGSYTENGKVIYFDKSKKTEEEIMYTSEINIRGNHNLYNSLASIISARAFEIKKEVIKKTLSEFKGVEHRIEFIRELNGIKFYNDSKATNTDSLIVALESFEGDIVLILGGRESGNDYDKVSEIVKRKVKTIVAIGETKDKIYNYFSKSVKVIDSGSMGDAVKKAYKAAGKDDVVLLSPACKSFDMFESFEHRGIEFKKEVNLLN